MVSIEKEQALKKRMDQLRIESKDLEEQFVQGSGKGGQKINKTSSCVVLKHLPTGIVVKCQESRSRELNRYHARKMLCDKLEGKGSKKAKLEEKAKKQKKRRGRRSSLKYSHQGDEGIQNGQHESKGNAPPEIVHFKTRDNQRGKPSDKTHDDKSKQP